MAKTMKAVDAVMVGMGWSGSIMARELTRAGLTVVGLERVPIVRRARTSLCLAFVTSSNTGCATSSC